MYAIQKILLAGTHFKLYAILHILVLLPGNDHEKETRYLGQANKRAYGGRKSSLEKKCGAT
jgi:hypothetical protein